jgi:hypothetical protein
MNSSRGGEKPLYLTKVDGTSEPFRREKLVESLLKVGASQEEANIVIAHVLRGVRPGMRTDSVYDRAFSMLRKQSRPVAARYSLRRSLHDLGPTGFPFEDFVAELLRREGYTVAVRQHLRGKCATHEVDIVAERGGECLIAELKFHNQAGYRTDLKTALYVGGRMMDLQMGPDIKCRTAHYALITNTKFTSQAIEYGECMRFDLLGFQYPKGRSLYDRVIAQDAYPVTALTSLSSREKRLLLTRGILLCDSLSRDRALAYSSGVSKGNIDRAIEESTLLCSTEERANRE